MKRLLCALTKHRRFRVTVRVSPMLYASYRRCRCGHKAST